MNSIVVLISKRRTFASKAIKVNVSDLKIYPLKSGKPISLVQSKIVSHGLQYDRHFSLFNSQNKSITAREFPKLLDIECNIESNNLKLTCLDAPIGTISLNDKNGMTEALRIHSYDAHGAHVDSKFDNWFSNYLGIACRLMKVNYDIPRNVLPIHGGHDLDVVGFGDQAPVLIIGQSTLEDLNRRLENPIKMDRFRPNIVIKGCAPYEEDNWNIITIGTLQFRIIQQCERCIFTTIDPETKVRNKEPLLTLSKYRKGIHGGVVFGVHAVPLQEGIIEITDPVTIQSYIDRPLAN